jgi:hypothetical protein
MTSLYAFALSVLSTIPPAACAEEQERDPTMVRGPFTLDASIGIEFRRDDNFFQSAVDEQTARYWVLTPSVLMSIEPSRQRYEFSYDGEYAWFRDLTDDDYDDHELEAGAYLLFGRSSGLDFVASYLDGHEGRGTGLTEGFIPGTPAFPEEPDQFTDRQILARYAYGVADTRARFELEAAIRDLEYDNNRTRTAQFDREIAYGQAAIGMRIQPNTSILLSGRATEISYDRPRLSGPGLDSTEYRYLLGIEWDVTGKTTGHVRVGHVEKQYDDPARPDFSGPSWEVDVRWSPRSYSHIDFGTERYPAESRTLTGDVIDTETYSASWLHEWSDRVASRLAFRRLDEDFRDSVAGRIQELEQIMVSLHYTMRSWLTFDVEFQENSRDSNVNRFIFDGKIVKIGVRIIL